MFDMEAPEIRFAIEAVRRGSLLARQVQLEMIEPALTKDDRSPVTVADFAVQALVGYLLEQSFSEIALVAEEDSAQLRESESRDTLNRVTHFVGMQIAHATPEGICSWIDRGDGEVSDRFWTLDPIDGTKGFLRGDQYAIALALIEAGEVRLGVMGCPNLVDAHRPQVGGPGTMVVAAKGCGAWHAPLEDNNGFTRLHVSDVADPAQLRILRSVESAHTNKGRISDVANAIGVQAPPVGMDSQAKYAVLASGQGDLLLRLLTRHQPDYRERIWDQAAGSLVVQEAGGRITDLDGKPLDFSAGRTLANNRGVCASNGPLHDRVLRELADIDPPAATDR